MEQKERLINLVNNFGDQLLDWLKDGGNFVKDQAPLICQEIVKFGQIIHLTAAISFFIMAILSIVVFCFCIKLFKKTREEDFILGVVMSSLGIIGFTIPAIYNVYMFIMTIYAPRLYLISELKDLFK